MTHAIDATGLALLFTEARTHNAWREEPVSDALLQRSYELACMAPTSANSNPMRIAFVRSPEAKERLRPALAPGNVAKTISAPVTAIFAYDTRFPEFMPTLFPPSPRMFADADETMRSETAFRNATLQAAYFMLAARALGLDLGPMSGFNRQQVNREFFPDGRWESNFLCNLGCGDPTKLHPRNPRLPFDSACHIL